MMIPNKVLLLPLALLSSGPTQHLLLVDADATTPLPACGRGIEVLPFLPCGDTESLYNLIGDTGVAAETCAYDLSGAANAVEKMSEFAGFLIELRKGLTDAQGKAESFKEFWGGIKALVKIIPILGKGIYLTGQSVASFATRFSTLLEELPSESKLQRIQGRLDKVANVLDTLGDATQAYCTQTTLYQDKLYDYSFVAALDPDKCLALEVCSKNDLIEFEGLKALFETCSGIFGQFNGDIIIDVDIVTDLAVLRGFEDFVNSTTVWVEGAVEDAKETATEAFCCNDVLRTLADIFKVFIEVLDLITCFPDAVLDTAVSELAFAVFGDLTSLISKVDDQTRTINAMLGALKSDVFETPKGLPSADGFDLGTPGICISDFAESTLEDIGDEELFDIITPAGNILNDLGKNIAGACGEAIEALQDRNNTEAVNCCDIPNTCDAADQIILFNGKGCTQNSAGTLSVPEYGLTNVVRATDQNCTADGGSRSLQLLGPIRAGLIIEIGDRKGRLCTGDYAAIVLDAELGFNDEMCVKSFEIGRRKVRKKMEGYTIHSNYKDGLDGEATQFVTSSGGISALCPRPKRKGISRKSKKGGKKEEKKGKKRGRRERNLQVEITSGPSWEHSRD
jgi:hypothetical protein